MSFNWLFVTIPLILTWVFVSYDVARSSAMPAVARGLWILTFTFVWPTMLLWLLIRRPSSRFGARDKNTTSPRAILVKSSLEHERELIDDQEMNRIQRQLRKGASP
jgi:hypothetical protein